MILAATAFTVAFWGYCGGMSVLARSDRAWVQHLFAHALSAVLYFALASGVACTFVQSGHPLITVPLFVIILIFGTLFGQGWIALVIGEFFDRFRSVAAGTARMKVERTYDKARKAEHDGDFDLAMRIYAEEAERDPVDPEPLRRMAELQVQRGRPEEGLALLERMSGLVKEDDARVALLFRRADLLEGAGRRDEAAALLESVAFEFAGTSLARGARDRLDALRRPSR